MSVTVGFLALLEAKPDRADELAAFLEQDRAAARLAGRWARGFALQRTLRDPDRSEIAAIFERHGMTLLGPPLSAD